jgi:hypothetical protein
MEALHISLPNTCALVIKGTNIAYVECTPEQNIFPPDGYTSFEQFVDPGDALARAREIDPEYSANTVLGSLVVTPTEVSNPKPAPSEGETVTLEFVCESSDSEAVLSYSWWAPDGKVIAGESEPTLVLSDVTPAMDGRYTCVVSASNAKGQTGSATGSFAVTVYPSVGAAAE